MAELYFVYFADSHPMLLLTLQSLLLFLFVLLFLCTLLLLQSSQIDSADTSIADLVHQYQSVLILASECFFLRVGGEGKSEPEIGKVEAIFCNQHFLPLLVVLLVRLLHLCYVILH